MTDFLKIWAKVESQPKQELYTRYEPSEQGDPVILRHVITAAHVRFAFNFQSKVERLYEASDLTMLDSDYTTALTLGFGSQVFYKEVDKVKKHGGVDIPYKVIEKIVSDPFLFYTLPPAESVKVSNGFKIFAHAHGLTEAIESYNQMQAILSAALPGNKPINEGDDIKKKSPTKK